MSSSRPWLEWVEDVLERQGYEELTEKVPDENRYFIEI